MHSLIEIKQKWNAGLERVKKAEKVAQDNPEKFEKFIKEFNNLCNEMSLLMEEYRQVTGKDINDNDFNKGFNLALEEI